MPVKPSFEERQKMKMIEDLVLDLFVALDSSRDTVDSLLGMYDEYKQSKEGSIDLVRHALLEQVREIDLYKVKADSLLSKIKGAKQLVTNPHCGLLE